jgi:transcriptional regulator with XRE-family HTH domain
MLHENEHRTASERFADLFCSIEHSDAYHIEGAKVEISEQIYLAMEQQGISKAELARRLGKSRAYVTKILQGNANFTIESLVRIARVLGCKFDFQFVAERAAESGLELAKIWQKSLGAPAVRHIAMKHRHEDENIRLVNPSPNVMQESESATISVAA